MSDKRGSHNKVGSFHVQLSNNFSILMNDNE